jgi:hypothetical protein
MVMLGGLFNQLRGPVRSHKSPMATPREMLDRLKGDVDSLVVGVLDDLTFEIIRAYKNSPPPGYLEWVSTTATRRVRRLARTIFHDRAKARSTHHAWVARGDADAMRSLVANWLQPQMEQGFGPLPDAVKKVFSVRTN